MAAAAAATAAAPHHAASGDKHQRQQKEEEEEEGVGQQQQQQQLCGRVADILVCPICLDVAQLPVNITCFQGCSGTQSRGAPGSWLGG